MDRARAVKRGPAAPRCFARLVVGLVASAACQPTPESYGGVTLVVDTDFAVPSQVARLRIDVFAEDGTWLDTRDVARRDPADYPASFTIFQTDETRGRTATVRVRAFPSGAMRDYRGERFFERPTGGRPSDRAPEPTAASGPRLVFGGLDVTPSREPDPVLAIDRLVRVVIGTSGEARVYVHLRAACAGTMADLNGGRTCVDTDGVLVPLDEAKPDQPTATSLVGKASAPVPCTEPVREAHSVAGVRLCDEETCIVGGMFVLGGDPSANYGTLQGDDTRPFPVRWARIEPLRVDRYEVTVARFRDAIARGFEPPEYPNANEGPLAKSASDPPEQGCTWSSAPRPGEEAREDYALTCVTWQTARAFCQFEGGDLPTEAEWEYVASAAGRIKKTLYPWGDETPSCARVIFGRSAFVGKADCLASYPYGPRPVAEGADDETPPILLESGSVMGRVHGLGGGVFEFVRDTSSAYASNCWRGAPQLEPSCTDPSSPKRTLRGGAWDAGALSMRAAARVFNATDGAFTDLGFRCMRKGSR